LRKISLTGQEYARLRNCSIPTVERERSNGSGCFAPIARPRRCRRDVGSNLSMTWAIFSMARSAPSPRPLAGGLTTCSVAIGIGRSPISVLAHD
jgi:hypothetical protein